MAAVEALSPAATAVELLPPVAAMEVLSPAATAVELLSPVADDGAEVISPPVAVVDAALRRPPAAVDGRAWEHEVDH